LNADLALQRLQRQLGYQFRDAALLLRALTHRSAGADHNERLEFLGDAVLGLEVSLALYQRHPTADEGQLSRMRAQLVKRETLAAVARALGLGDYLRLGPGELRSGGQSRDSTLADALEAVIAAVYLDGGIPAAQTLIQQLLAARVAQITPQNQRKDAKTRLQELLQGRAQELPVYTVVEITGEAHAQTFLVRCEVPGLQLQAQGAGASRRKAEQAAARAALAALGED
jgi:ribonuclease-3